MSPAWSVMTASRRSHENGQVSVVQILLRSIGHSQCNRSNLAVQWTPVWQESY